MQFSYHRRSSGHTFRQQLRRLRQHDIYPFWKHVWHFGRLVVYHLCHRVSDGSQSIDISQPESRHSNTICRNGIERIHIRPACASILIFKQRQHIQHPSDRKLQGDRQWPELWYSRPHTNCSHRRVILLHNFMDNVDGSSVQYSWRDWTGTQHANDRCFYWHCLRDDGPVLV